jgi:NAD(P)-dependent dehydrogenase (short-subunit alcohol dehydrogenase family)
MSGTLERRAALGGRVAALIGGGGGIGRAATLALAEAGVDVAVCDRDGEALGATRELVQSLGRRCVALELDATDTDSLRRFYAETGAAFDRLDIVVNVVGGTRRVKLMEATDEQLIDDVRRNYLYVVQSVREAVPLIRRTGRGGSIINFTTIEAFRGAAGFSVYAGAKAATTNFTRAMAVELGSERIRLNCIVPDTTPSQGNMNAIEGEALAAMGRLPPEAQGAGLAMYIPMKAAPSVDDLANTVLFLASDLSSAITGTSIHVDGGTMAAAGFLDWPFGDGHLPVPFAGTLSRLYPS